MSKLDRISITIERDLLEAFDAVLAEGKVRNRSEGLRDLVRARLAADALEDPDAPAVGTLTLLFDHNKRELSERITSLGHDHHHTVLASMHQHLDHDHCLEVMTLTGTAGQLRALARSFGGLKGVLHAELVLTAPPGARAS